MHPPQMSSHEASLGWPTDTQGGRGGGGGEEEGGDAEQFFCFFFDTSLAPGSSRQVAAIIRSAFYSERLRFPPFTIGGRKTVISVNVAVIYLQDLMSGHSSRCREFFIFFFSFIIFQDRSLIRQRRLTLLV